MAKHVSVLAIYEQEPDYIVPSAILQIVEEEGSNVATSEFYLQLILNFELGETDSDYIIEHFILTPEEVVSPYATEKLLNAVYDSNNDFPQYINLHIDEDYLNYIDEQHYGTAQ